MEPWTASGDQGGSGVMAAYKARRRGRPTRRGRPARLHFKWRRPVLQGHAGGACGCDRESATRAGAASGERGRLCGGRRRRL